MSYYILQPDLGAHFPVGPSDDVELLPIMDHLRGSTPHASWYPIELSVLSEDEYGEAAGLSDALVDLMDFNATGIHVVSETFRSRLVNFLDYSCELLPVSLNGERHYISHVLKILDALDFQKSEIERFSSGGIKFVGKFSLKRDVIAGNDIFRLAGIRHQQVFVSDKFAQAARVAGLSGFLFSPIEAH